MGHDSVRPAYAAPRKEPPRRHDRFLKGFWSGQLEVVLDFPKEHPLVIGAGWLELERKATRSVVKSANLQQRHAGARVKPTVETVYDERLVSEMVRRQRNMPVIPGSSLKGAVRQVHELLTPSCGWSKPCFVNARTALAEARVCPVCSLFGANGLMGRLRFHEGVPGQGVTFGKVKVPAAWKPQRWESSQLRVYDQRRDLDRDHQPRNEDEWAYSTCGPYHCRLTLVNATEDELGVLLAALGVGWSGPGPGLRLGGKKFHGFGAAVVKLAWAEQRPASLGQAMVLRLNDDAAAWAKDLRDHALDREPARRRAWKDLHDKLARTEETHHADS